MSAAASLLCRCPVAARALSPQATALVERLGKVSRALKRRNVVGAEGQASVDVRSLSNLPMVTETPAHPAVCNQGLTLGDNPAAAKHWGLVVKQRCEDKCTSMKPTAMIRS